MIVFVLKAIAGKLQELYPDCTVQRAYIPEQDRIKLGKMDRPLMSVILDDRSGEALDRSGTRIFKIISSSTWCCKKWSKTTSRRSIR